MGCLERRERDAVTSCPSRLAMATAALSSTPVEALQTKDFTWSGLESRNSRARDRAYTPISSMAPPARERLKKRLDMS